MQPYIIFALNRTGSTTLLQLLNCREGVRCIFEPFNTTNVNPHLRKCCELRKERGLHAVVKALWRGCNGFKHVWQWDGFPFFDNPDVNRQMLVEQGAKIILMHRKNRLHRAISIQVSEQMKLWTPYLPEHFQQIREHQFQPLDIEWLRRDIEDAGKAMEWARQQIQDNQIPAIEVAYEDFFAPKLSMQSRIDAVQVVLQFIRVGPETDEARLANMRNLFNPATTGFQNAEAYHKIPNIHEVNAALGSVDSGFVFESGSRSS